MEGKKPWQSKTIVVNAVLGLMAALAVFMPGANDVASFINSHGGEIAVGWSILNVLLRLITKEKITLVD